MALRLIQGGAEPPHHPRLDGAVPLVARIGVQDARILDAFEGYGMATVARSAAQHRATPNLTVRARSLGLAAFVDPDTAFNQLAPSERPAKFSGLEYEIARAWNPSLETLTRDEERGYVRLVLQMQAEAKATLIVPPYHHCGDLEDPARQLDLRLARIAARQFRQARLSESDQARLAIERQLFAAIMVDLATLRDPLSRVGLINAYADLEVDGFIVKIVGFCEDISVPNIEVGVEFLLGLQTRSLKPVVAVGGKNLGPALVGEGLAAQLIGIGEGEVVRFPPVTLDGPRVWPVFHAAALRSVDPRSQSEAARRRAEELFERSPCDCGHHPGAEPPPLGFARKAHTFSKRSEVLHAVGAGLAARRRSELDGRYLSAIELNLSVGYVTRPPYDSVQRAAARIRRRAGLEATGEELG